MARENLGHKKGRLRRVALLEVWLVRLVLETELCPDTYARDGNAGQSKKRPDAHDFDSHIVSM